MNDTFAAGVEPGGLRTSQEIKILICYLLRTVEQPMLRDDVTDILVGNGMANYFDIEEAMEELLRLQHLVQSDDRRIATTVSGAQIGDELSVRIPYTLRERSVKAALRLFVFLPDLHQRGQALVFPHQVAVQLVVSYHRRVGKLRAYLIVARFRHYQLLVHRLPPCVVLCRIPRC